MTPEDIGKDGWFEQLPILTKEHLRNNFDQICDESQRSCMGTMTTGGSTGTPTRSGYDLRIPEEVYYRRLQSWFGVDPWDDIAYIWREKRKTSLAKLKNAALWWPTRHLKLDASFMTDDGILRFLKQYNKLRPAMIYGYVGAVSQVARLILDRGIDVHAPKFVCTTSAPLPLSQRKIIERAFRAPVADQYGSCEIRWIAQQCPECGGLHVNVDHVAVEFVDDNGHPVAKGQYGRTLLTNLEDTVFPLIRYENGDRGRWLDGACLCGRTLPLMDSVKGRESESFRLADGRTINGEFLTTVFDDAPELVRGFRIVQHNDLSITVEYVPEGDEQRIFETLASFASRIGSGAKIDFRRVDNIPHDKGKLRFIVRD